MEFKSEKYGAWTIRIRKTKEPKYGSILYEYKIELHGNDISRGWISVPYGSNKATAIVYAKDAIDSNYKNTTLISESGGVLRQRYDQFRGTTWG